MGPSLVLGLLIPVDAKIVVRNLLCVVDLLVLRAPGAASAILAHGLLLNWAGDKGALGSEPAVLRASGPLLLLGFCDLLFGLYVFPLSVHYKIDCAATHSQYV